MNEGSLWKFFKRLADQFRNSTVQQTSVLEIRNKMQNNRSGKSPKDWLIHELAAVAGSSASSPQTDQVAWTIIFMLGNEHGMDRRQIFDAVLSECNTEATA